MPISLKWKIHMNICKLLHNSRGCVILETSSKTKMYGQTILRQGISTAWNFHIPDWDTAAANLESKEPYSNL